VDLRTGQRYAAWHDSGTYNKETGEGGANGTVRFEKEITAAPNAGLNTAIKLLKKIKSDCPDVTYADLFQLASATAIEVSHRPMLPSYCRSVARAAPLMSSASVCTSSRL
jgi:L-ascorbate peroxidase